MPGDEGRPARPLPHGGTTPPTGLELDALIVAGDVLADDALMGGALSRRRRTPSPPGASHRWCSRDRSAQHRPAGVIVWFAVGAPDAGVDVGPALGARSVWVRDPATLSRIGGTAVYSGDPLFLAARVFPAEAIRKRADLLRLCGALPAGRRLVVEWSRGGASDLEHVGPALSGALRADPTLVVIVREPHAAGAGRRMAARRRGAACRARAPPSGVGWAR